MPAAPCLICQQSQEVKTTIIEMAKNDHYAVIVDWLHEREIMATYNQVRYFIAKFNVDTRLQKIQPVNGYKAKVRAYIGELLKHNTSTYTIKNLRLCGASWSEVTKRLHEDGLIESMSRHPRTRWRILASKEELKTWCDKQCETHIMSVQKISITKEHDDWLTRNDKRLSRFIQQKIDEEMIKDGSN